MATRNVDMDADNGWLHVATGPQNATFGFKTGVGEYATELNADVPPADGVWSGLAPTSLALVANEKLYIQGQGRLVLIADTPEI
ncbi:hypothetical protein KX928_12535 [Roseobacter sp. YSTF-M11]|uniref:Uncharacterized protein n=1 Tax=Roseobacter insulae TaxID=2859783 RepID=A0A9X1FW03_9RHOB|nr:hypothetical protein [Roseobacter insulae]MBW4708611.1 hypothetical protein [Roseobacter insulae]